MGQEQRRKPDQPLLDRGHPLASGLTTDLPLWARVTELDPPARTVHDRVYGYSCAVSGTGFTWNNSVEVGAHLSLSGASGSDWLQLSNHNQTRGNSSLVWQGSTGGKWAVQVILRCNAGANASTLWFDEESAGIARMRWGVTNTNLLNLTTRFDAGGATSFNSTATVADGTWKNIVGVWDDASTPQFTWYVDGAQSNQGTWTQVSTFAWNRSVLGCQHDGTPQDFFNGDIALFRTWQRALTAEEVFSLYVNPWQIYRNEPEILTPSGFQPEPSGSGAATLQTPTATGTGNSTPIRSGSGTPDLPVSTGNGQGFRVAVGDSTESPPTIPTPTAFSDGGEVVKIGSGGADLPVVTGSGAGDRVAFGSGTPDLPVVTGSGTGVGVVSASTGSGTPALPAPTATGTGTAGSFTFLVKHGASRRSPLGVTFDAADFAPAGVAQPFYECEFKWDFGDPGQGNWAYGNQEDKNVMWGAIGAHVYEPGLSQQVYTITLDIRLPDNSTQQYQQNLTVEGEQTGLTTVYYHTRGTDMTGAPPAGGSNPTVVHRINSTWDSVRADLSAANVGVYLKRGDSWSGAAQADTTHRWRPQRINFTTSAAFSPGEPNAGADDHGVVRRSGVVVGGITFQARNSATDWDADVQWGTALNGDEILDENGNTATLNADPTEILNAWDGGILAAWGSGNKPFVSCTADPVFETVSHDWRIVDIEFESAVVNAVDWIGHDGALGAHCDYWLLLRCISRDFDQTLSLNIGGSANPQWSSGRAHKGWFLAEHRDLNPGIQSMGQGQFLVNIEEAAILGSEFQHQQGTSHFGLRLMTYRRGVISNSHFWGVTDNSQNFFRLHGQHFDNTEGQGNPYYYGTYTEYNVFSGCIFDQGTGAPMWLGPVGAPPENNRYRFNLFERNLFIAGNTGNHLVEVNANNDAVVNAGQDTIHLRRNIWRVLQRGKDGVWIVRRSGNSGQLPPRGVRVYHNTFYTSDTSTATYGYVSIGGGQAPSNEDDCSVYSNLALHQAGNNPPSVTDSSSGTHDIGDNFESNGAAPSTTFVSATPNDPVDFKLKDLPNAAIDGARQPAPPRPELYHYDGTSLPTGVVFDFGAWEHDLEITNSGSGAATIPTPAAAGTGVGILVNSGSGAPTLPVATATGDGVLVAVGSGTPDLPTPTADGTGVGVAPTVGSGTPLLPGPFVTGTGKAVFAGSGAADVPTPTATGTGLLPPIGSGTPDLPVMTAAGTGVGLQTHIGSGTPDLPVPTATGTGNFVAAAQGSGDPDLPVLIGAGTGLYPPIGSGGGVIPAPIGRGGVPPTGGGKRRGPVRRPHPKDRWRRRTL